jgi:hypothetical protein
LNRNEIEDRYNFWTMKKRANGGSSADRRRARRQAEADSTVLSQFSHLSRNANNRKQTHFGESLILTYLVAAVGFLVLPFTIPSFLAGAIAVAASAACVVRLAWKLKPIAARHWLLRATICFASAFVPFLLMWHPLQAKYASEHTESPQALPKPIVEPALAPPRHTGKPPKHPPSTEEIANAVAKKLQEQQSHIICRNDRLDDCSDLYLIAWSKVLLSRIQSLVDVHTTNAENAMELEPDQRIGAFDQADRVLLRGFRDCCAEDSARLCRELSQRVGGGNQEAEFLEWDNQLLGPEGSADWESARKQVVNKILYVLGALRNRVALLENNGRS